MVDILRQKLISLRIISHCLNTIALPISTTFPVLVLDQHTASTMSNPLNLYFSNDKDIYHSMGWNTGINSSSEFARLELNEILGLVDGEPRWGYRGFMDVATNVKLQGGPIMTATVPGPVTNGKATEVIVRVDLSKHIRYDPDRRILHQYNLPVVPKEKLDAADKKTAELGEKVSQLEKTVEEQTKKISASETKAKGFKAKLDEAQKDAKDSRSKLDASEKELKELKAQFEQAAEEVKKAEALRKAFQAWLE